MKKKVLLTYIGKRKFGAASVAPCFLYKVGKKEHFCWFTKVKYARIGDLYEMVDDKLSTSPESKGEAKVEEKVLERWKTEEWAAEQWARERRGITRANKIKIEEKRLSELYRISEDLDWEAREAFINRVRKYLYRGVL